MKKIISIFFVFISIQVIVSQTSYYLEGLLGKNKIYLTIHDYDNEIVADYFKKFT